MGEERYELPASWAWARIGELAAISAGGPAPQGRNYFEDGRHLFVRVQDLGRLAGRVLVDATRDLINDRAVEECRLRLFPQGTVLFTKSGMSTLLNQRGILGRPAYVVSHIGCADPSVAATSEWLYYTLRQVDLGALTQATTLPSLKLSRVAQVEVPLAPLPEQRRIVAKIEALFQQSRTARQALDHIPPLLKKFRQAVLAAAFRGDLTRDWREQNPDVEPASALLDRIQTARLRRWQEEVRKAKAEGCRPQKRPASLDPPAVDTSGLPELPRHWAWASVEFLARQESRSIQSGPFGSNLRHSEFQDTGVLAIGIDNVLDGRFTSGSQHRISQRKYEQLKKYTARPLDVLITVMATVGRCCLVPEDIETAIITKHVYRISVDGELCEPSYLMNALRGCPAVQDQLYGEIQGVTRPGINGEILKRLLIPVAPLEEQRAIISRIETLLSQAEIIGAALKTSAHQADKLEQSILARAFRGELVPQDPNDEPACVLLDRIRASHAGDSAGKWTRNNGPRKKRRHGVTRRMART